MDRFIFNLLMAAILVVGFCGCESMPAVEFCYIHPTYGQVCVTVGGKKHYREDLTPEQRAQVDKWIKEQEGK